MIETAACIKPLIENLLYYFQDILESHEFIGLEKEYEKIFPINDLMLAE